MAKCSRCFRENHSGSALCPNCIRLDNQLKGSKDIAEKVLRDSQQALRSQQDMLAMQADQSLQNSQRKAEQTAKLQEESNQRLLHEQQKLAALNDEREQNRIVEMRHLHKESHLDAVKIKLVDCVIQKNEEGAVLLLGGTDVEYNIGFFWRDIINSEMLQRSYFKSFLKKYSRYFIEPESHYTPLLPIFFDRLSTDPPTRNSLWKVGCELTNSGLYEFAEPIWNVLYDLSVQEACYSSDPSFCVEQIVYAHYKRTNNAEECLARIDQFINSNDAVHGIIYYVRAWYLSILNKVTEAKESFKEHIERMDENDRLFHCEKALSDPGFANLESFIKDVKDEQTKQKVAREKAYKEQQEATKKRIEAEQQSRERADRIKKGKRTIEQWGFIPLKHIVSTLVVISATFIALQFSLQQFHLPLLQVVATTLISFVIVKYIMFKNGEIYKAKPHYAYKEGLFNIIGYITSLFWYIKEVIFACISQTVFSIAISIFLIIITYISQVLYKIWIH